MEPSKYGAHELFIVEYSRNTILSDFLDVSYLFEFNYSPLVRAIYI